MNEKEMTILNVEFEPSLSYPGRVEMTALVESGPTPDVGEVAESAGFHPTGYGCSDLTVEPATLNGVVAFGKWLVQWIRWKSCD